MTILEMYNKGYLIKVIAWELGVSRTTVNRRLRLCDGYIPRATGTRPIDNDSVKLAASMFSTGSKWAEITAITGFHKRTLQRAVRNYAAQSAI